MRVEVRLPELGAATVVLSVWFAEVGEEVLEGERLVEVLAGGATFDVASPVTGRLVVKHAWPRDVLQTGQLLGEMEREND